MYSILARQVGQLLHLRGCGGDDELARLRALKEALDVAVNSPHVSLVKPQRSEQPCAARRGDHRAYSARGACPAQLACLAQRACTVQWPYLGRWPCPLRY